MKQHPSVQHLLPLLFCVAIAIALGTASSSLAEQRNAPSSADMDRLIRQLGSSEYEVRSAARAELEKIGQTALDRLIRGSRDAADPEIRRACKDLVTAIMQKVSRRCQGPKVSVSQMAFSPDRRLVLSYSGAAYGDEQGPVDLRLRLWEIRTGNELFSGEGHPGRAGDLAFSPDGKRAVSTGFEPQDTAVRVWDLALGTELGHLVGDTGPVYSAIFSPDGRLVLTSSSDRTVRLWDVEKAKEVARVQGAIHPSAIFSPDGRRVVACSGGFQAIGCWDLVTGKEVQRVRGDFPA